MSDATLQAPVKKINTTVGWIIDRDHLSEESEREGQKRAEPGTNDNAVGMIGPRSFEGDPEKVCVHKFRMRDDDGVIYYSGRCSHNDCERALRPLDDFGMPNAGATTIEYWQPGKGGGWKALNG